MDLKRFGIAVASALAALVLKMVLDPVAAQEAVPFALFPAAVMVAAWYGGLSAGVVCTLISAVLSDLFYSSPRFTLWVESGAQRLMLIEFVAEGLIISVLAGALHTAKDRARSATNLAETAQRSSEHAMDEMQRVQSAKNASDLRFESLVEANIIGIFVAKEEGRILYANPAFLEMVGCNEEELGSGHCDWREMTADEYAEADRAALQQMHEQGACQPYEKEFVRPDNVRVPVLIGATVIESDHEMICFAADLTKQKAVERQLGAAKEAAETASEAKTHFLANISHELRTPMNAILGMTELALDEDVSSLVRDYLETAKGSADTLLYLLDDLLDFSRMEAGTFELESEPFNLRETLDESAKALSLRASEKGLELACYVHSDVPPWIHGDSHRLRQIITNLAGNAIKFTDRGEVVISATVDAIDEDVVRVVIVVSDTGIGISAEDQARIFAPFTQADASMSRKRAGSGLGLSICRELVEKMEGRIGVESAIGEGSRFHFAVPFHLATGMGAPAGDDVPAAELRDMPVLVVDDNATNRRILHETLASWSLKPTVVGDAQSALEILQEHQSEEDGFPLVIVDALMPETDGLTLVETAKAEGVLHGATILMLSSADRHVFQRRCEELEIDNFLEKPVARADLLHAIITGLGLEDSRDDAGPTSAVQATKRALHILVAEDTLANQKIVEAILRKRGHVVELAANGREAVDLHWEHDFDVILMDVQMPTMDGFQATRVIRECDDDVKATVPIVAMTAHAMEGDRKRCLSAGMDAYISKPLDAKKLVRLVEERASGSTATLRHDASTMSADDDTSSSSRLQIDRDAALRRLGGDEDLFHDLVQFFRRDVPSLVDAISAGIHRQDREQVSRAAHSVKGLAANFGGDDAVKAASAIESLGNDGKWEEIHPLYAQLRTEVAGILDALKAN